MLVDYHVHTKWCGHAVGEPEEFVEVALSRGLAEIGFSAHLPITIPTDEKLTLELGELDLLAERVEKLREQFGGRITVRLAGEADYIPGSEAEISRVIGRHPLDYVIGSVHFIGDWGVDNPGNTAEYERRDVRLAYEQYFALLQQAVETGLFDIIGHLDLMKVFGYRPPGGYFDMAQGVLRAIAARNLCIDVNMGGLDKPVGEAYPSQELLTECCRLGIGATLGSDSHRPEQVGRYFDRAVDALRSAGYREIALFDRRRRTDTPLPTS